MNRFIGPMGGISFESPVGWAATSTSRSVTWTKDFKTHPDTEEGLCTGADIYDRGAELSLTLLVDESRDMEIQGFHCGEGGCEDPGMSSSTRSGEGYRAIEHPEFTDFCSSGMRGIDTHFVANGLIHTVALRTATKDFAKYKPAYDALVASLRFQEGEASYGDVAIHDDPAFVVVDLKTWNGAETAEAAAIDDGHCIGGKPCLSEPFYETPIFRYGVAISINQDAEILVLNHGMDGVPTETMRKLAWPEYRTMMAALESGDRLGTVQRPFHLFFKNGKIVRMVEQYKP
jgi:hypothetical protein